MIVYLRYGPGTKALVVMRQLPVAAICAGRLMSDASLCCSSSAEKDAWVFAERFSATSCSQPIV